jgi:tripartite-type tricarboxylate transporter receptor subunit TctC
MIIVSLLHRHLGKPPSLMSDARQAPPRLRVILALFFFGADMFNLAWKSLALSLGLCMVQGTALAQDFLSKPVRIVVPQTPGGASDALARIVGQKLSEKWGQAVVIENRAGAGGNVGMEHVAQAAADGHTLLMSYAGSHAINAALYKKLPFDPEKDFEPVATLATLPFVLVVRPDSPVKSINLETAVNQLPQGRLEV